jgi:hypothetical protein
VLSQYRRNDIDFVSILHGGALPIPLQQSRSSVAEDVLWQFKLSELLQLPNLRERVIEARPAQIHFQLLKGRVLRLRCFATFCRRTEQGFQPS